MCANSYNLADPLMPADEWEFGCKGPVALARVQVRVAYASAMQLDETLSRGELLRLLDRVVFPDLNGRIV